MLQNVWPIREMLGPDILCHISLKHSQRMGDGGGDGVAFPWFFPIIRKNDTYLYSGKYIIL